MGSTAEKAMEGFDKEGEKLAECQKGDEAPTVRIMVNRLGI